MDNLFAGVLRQVALALSDPQIRLLIHQQLQNSPYREQKLHFRSLLASEPRLLSAMAAAGNTRTEKILATLDSLVDFEFYMPVPTHRAEWKGDSRLLVAGGLDPERRPPIGFDLAGRAVPMVGTEPPATPVLAIVPTETDFTVKRGGGPRTSVSATGAFTESTGVYMTFSRISSPDSYEHWMLGSPEFEVHAFVRNDAGRFVDLQCAGADQIGALQYDQNGYEWTGRVLLILDSDIGQHQVEFQVWEDDSGPCTWDGGRPPKTDGATMGQYWDFAARIIEAVSGGVRAIVMAVPAIIDFLEAVQKDESVGAIHIKPPCWNPIDPDRTPLYIKEPGSGAIVGEVKLDITSGTHEPLCPVLRNPSVYGWSQVAPGQIETWSASFQGGTGTYDVHWGGVLTGDGFDITGSLSYSGTLFMYVTSADDQYIEGECYITVMDNPGPYLCP